MNGSGGEVGDLKVDGGFVTLTAENEEGFVVVGKRRGCRLTANGILGWDFSEEI